MLTQGPAPDPKCKLIISSFLTLSGVLRPEEVGMKGV